MFAGKPFSKWGAGGQRVSRLPLRGPGVLLTIMLAAVAVLCQSGAIEAGSSGPNPVKSHDSTGVLSTLSIRGGIDQANPFFQSLGTNGRSCSTCHVAGDAWSITPEHVQARFNSSNGLDPIFRPVDGANCPSADVSTLDARRAAYSQLLEKGLIRVSISVPSGADFSILGIQDPFSCPQTTVTQPALYRRPLPATNLRFLSTVMWDGRETVFGAVPGKSIDLTKGLTNQAFDATMGHAQASQPPTAKQLVEIVAFETGLYTAQANDQAAGQLDANGALGGPVHLSQQEFHVGINDSLGGDPTGRRFSPLVFTIYDSWAHDASPQRRAIARGEALFNSLPITISGVAGLNDLPGVPASFTGTCGTCHDSPNAGDHSFSVPLDIGTTDFPALPSLDVSGLPVYTVQCSDGTGKTVTDLGRAMISGKCKDVGKVKGPVLRGLAGRAPYFHNGSARTLDDVLEFYNERFNLNLTEQQKGDVVAFLQTL